MENRHSEISESISRGPVRGAKHSLTGKEYVLQDFSEEEMAILLPVIDRIIKDLVNKVSN